MASSININRIIISSIHLLNWHALQYAVFCATQTENHMRRGELKIKLESYPACVVCFQSRICGSLSYGYSGQYKLQPDSFRSPLRGMLHELGSIGDTCDFTNSENRIGKCAEVCAVNAFLYECEKCRKNVIQYYPYGCGRYYIESEIGTRDFMLSEAFRPRTLEHIYRCENCMCLFGSN